MANELIINASLPETRIALMEDGEIQELLIERASGKGIVGNIYKGRVTRVLPGMQAAFVDIGLEKAAFLYVDDVYVHSEIWEEEEGPASPAIKILADVQSSENDKIVESGVESENKSSTSAEASTTSDTAVEPGNEAVQASEGSTTPVSADSSSEDEQAWRDENIGNIASNDSRSDQDHDHDRDLRHSDHDDLDSDEDDSGDPVGMGPDDENEEGHGKPPEGTISAERTSEGGNETSESREPRDAEAQSTQAEGNSSSEANGNAAEPQEGEVSRRRHRRGRRGGRFRRRGPNSEGAQGTGPSPVQPVQQNYPDNYHEQIADTGAQDSDRSGLLEEHNARGDAARNEGAEASVAGLTGRPEGEPREASPDRRPQVVSTDRPEFRSQRSRDRRIRQKSTNRPVRAQVNIQDLLKEGQEVLVQVAKDPIATKGARLTCHISLPGRHLVCMPTIDHVGVSRRIERDDERRRLREFVERNRPRNLGFIVRTASGKQQSEKRIKQDIEYLTRLWTEIREKAGTVTAPALVYEDLNSVLRAIRDWVTEEIDKVIVDSRYHYNDILRFVSHFMPALKQKVELYHGDIPIFDAYGISTELSRALERKVWLKSGGYIVVDQSEALVAIDVNTGRYVGKKSLEDTILKTNLEAVQEIAYQLRLRNCGGIIILDLIDMEKDENKQRVYRALEDALSRDRARPTILKISELGLVEMTRKRTRDTIIRTLCESCTHCEGKGFIKSKQTVAYEVMREIEREGIDREVSKILVQAHPDVIDILAIDERETVDQLERKYRKQIYLQAVTDFHSEQFEVSADKQQKSERGREQVSGRDSQHRDRPHHEHNSDRNRGRDRHRHESSNSGITVNPVGGAPAATESLIVKKPVPIIVENPPVITPVEGGAAPVITPSAVVVSPTSAPRAGDEFFDEEDRLAFLRAQATQDAALARLGSGGGSGHQGGARNGGGGGGGQDRGAGPGGRRGARGRRGGKFRGRDNGRNDNRAGSGGSPGGMGRGPKPFGYGPTPKRPEPIIKDTAASSEGNVTSQGSEGSSGGSGGGDRNGGGDHSQPPV